jgi:acyl-CoA thioesterase-1
MTAAQVGRLAAATCLRIHPVALLALVGIALFSTAAPSSAQTVNAPAADIADTADAAKSTALTGGAEARPPCSYPREFVHLDHPLARVATKIASGETIRVEAIGSSSTAGAGASSPAASYPSQLAMLLKREFHSDRIEMINRGVNGDDAPQMLARFGDMLAEAPDVVLWQVGTNSVLRDEPLARHVPLLHDGLRRLKAAKADVIVIDPQYAPKVIKKPDSAAMVDMIAGATQREGVDLFRRFDLMRYWREGANLPFDTFVSPDGLHMNDWGYACLAKALSVAMLDAVRPSPALTATATAVRRPLP